MARRKPLRPEGPNLAPLPPPHQPLPGVWRWAAILLIVAYAGLALGHLNVTPVATGNLNYINAPDEAAHIQYVRALAVGRRLPVEHDARFPTYEWHQPPLYYMLCSPFFGGGPHALRAVSLVLGLLSLVYLYRAVRRLFPDDGVIAVLALAFAALLPMRQAITASVGNDALTELCFTLALYHIVEAFRGGLTPQRALYLGLTVAAALLTKATGLLLVPIVGVALYLLTRESETREDVLRGAAVVAVAALFIAGPWYVRNVALYHELTPVKAFVRDFGGTMTAAKWLGRSAPLANIWTGGASNYVDMTRGDYLGLVANWTFGTYWAAYTPTRLAGLGVPVFLPPSFYVLYALLCAVGLGGLVRLHLRRKTDTTTLQQHVIRLSFLTLGLVAASFVSFIWVFFQTQGRYLYPALAATALLWAAGFRAATPGRYRDALAGLVLVLLAALAAAFLFTAVMPAYGG